MINISKLAKSDFKVQYIILFFRGKCFAPVIFIWRRSACVCLPELSGISPFPIPLCGLLLEHNVIKERDCGFKSLITRPYCCDKCKQ